MDSTVTLPWIGVLVIFVAGVIVGWLVLGKFSGRLSVGVRPQLPGEFSAPGFHIQTTHTRTMVVKCQCGTIWTFREGSGPFPPNVEPMPAGDSFICKKCGRSIDLKQGRQLEADMLRNAGPGA